MRGLTVLPAQARVKIVLPGLSASKRASFQSSAVPATTVTRRLVRVRLAQQEVIVLRAQPILSCVRGALTAPRLREVARTVPLDPIVSEVSQRQWNVTRGLMPAPLDSNRVQLALPGITVSRAPLIQAHAWLELTVLKVPGSAKIAPQATFV